jgi:non-ribosomal peptide synthetase component E (peptide arylation enzyme)
MDEAFLAQVEERGDAPAIVDANLDVALSWRDYGTAARRVAAGLAGLGLGRGATSLTYPSDQQIPIGTLIGTPPVGHTHVFADFA